MQLLSLEQNNSSFKQTVPDPGDRPGRPGSPLFLDQSEAQRAEKIWGEDQPPLPYLRVWINNHPPSLSQGLDPALAKVTRIFWKNTILRNIFFPGKWPTQLEDNEVNVLRQCVALTPSVWLVNLVEEDQACFGANDPWQGRNGIKTVAVRICRKCKQLLFFHWSLCLRTVCLSYQEYSNIIQMKVRETAVEGTNMIYYP